MKQKIAHVMQTKDEVVVQDLKEHLMHTAALCREYMRKTGCPAMGYLAGILHDAGKAGRAFQDRMEAIRAGPAYETGPRAAECRQKKESRLCAMNRDILTIIRGKMSTFSKGQKLIGRYILENYDKAAFMTAARLGQAVRISESTVVRFAAELGYDGYPAMQKAMQEMIRGKLTTVQRIEVSYDRLGSQGVLDKVVQSDIEKLRMTLSELRREDFDGAVDAIVGAKRIYILGVRSSAALSDFLTFYFKLIFNDVCQVQTSLASEMFEQMLRVGEGDVVIGISFPRYSTRSVRAMEFARDQGATVVAITDSEMSPLYDTADFRLLAKSDMVSFADSLVAPLSIINALIVAVGRKKSGEVTATFERLERIWDEYQVYEKVEYEDK